MTPNKKFTSRNGLATLIACPTLLLAVTPALFRSPYAGAMPHQNSERPHWTVQTNRQYAIPRPPKSGTRGPIGLTFSSDGKLLFFAEQDENRVTVLEPDSGKTVGRIPTGGEQPVALALSPDGKTLAVANSFSGSVGILDAEKRSLRTTVPLLGQPCGVVITTGGQAFVSVSQLDQVAVIDLGTGKVITRIPVGRNPRALTLTPDGGTLLCANMLDGSLSVIDVAACKEQGRIKLPAINLRGMAIAPDGRRLYVSGQIPHNDLPTDRPEAMWSNVLCVVGLNGGTGVVERTITLDLPDRGAADPCGVVLDPRTGTIYTALGGTHEVALIPMPPTEQKTVSSAGLTEAVVRVPVGTNPRSLALRPNSAELWVGNYLNNSLDILPTLTTANPPAVRRVDLDTPTPSPNRRLKGRFLFSSAHITRGGRFTCETCHPDGGVDGLSWKLAHFKDGLETHNTRDLRGNLLLTAPYGWTAREEDLMVFINDEISGLLKTHRLIEPEVHALWDLVNEMPLPPNPYRQPDGTMTAEALQGKELFRGKAGCTTCHIGDQHGGVKKMVWIGTTPDGVKLDVPHLEGAYQSAPYLHDGRAATLEEVFTKYDSKNLHGKAHELTPAELHAVLEYIRQM